MFRPRVIPVLLLKDEGLVKSKQFKNHRYIGDPLNAVKIFNDLKADELIFLDIQASKKNRLVSLDLVKSIGEEANMPFGVGGGIKTLKDIQNIIANGAEKVIIGSAAVVNPNFIKEASEEFGTSTIAVCMDLKKSWLTKKTNV
ncbi:MAG: tRNA-dihydrouridine synthase, partial [Bacteroidetes bacterium]|nr:tRNA-dihydrouridine synthase [Bacteroidota bacterium]